MFMKAAKKQLFGNVTEFAKHWSREEITVENDELGSSNRSKARMGLSRLKKKHITAIISEKSVNIRKYEAVLNVHDGCS